jgi:hypothetical protein
MSCNTLFLANNGNGAIDFVTDLVLHSGNHPGAKYLVCGDVEVTGEFPCFIVVSSSKVERKYTSDANGNCTVYKFVLMDGSGSLFKAVTNSTLAGVLCNFNVEPGCSLIVYDYELVWMHGFHEYEFRFVMLVNKCTWKNSPSNSQDLGRDVKCIDTRICCSAIEAVEMEGIAVFTLPILHRFGVEYFNAACNMGQLEDGDWIAEPCTRYQWNAFICPLLDVAASDAPGIRRSDSMIKDITTWDMSPKKSVVVADDSKKECQCVSDFGLCQCVCETFPVDELEYYDIFTSAVCRIATLRDSDIVAWESLKPTHKRWCLYWWYAVNIFGLRSAAPLPTCIVDSVRNAFPNPVGVQYTGYKSSVERAKGKENKTNKRAKHVPDK